VIVNSSKGLRQLGQQVVEGWFSDKGNLASLLHMREKNWLEEDGTQEREKHSSFRDSDEAAMSR
jgi:hypothetical protein